MSNSISTLLTRNLHDVFGENDPARRRAAIDEIDRVACAIKATHPDFRYQPIAGPDEHQRRDGQQHDAGRGRGAPLWTGALF